MPNYISYCIQIFIPIATFFLANFKFFGFRHAEVSGEMQKAVADCAEM